MKLLLLLCSFALLHPTPPSLLVLDMNGKKPPQPATTFSTDQYLLRKFPVYAADLKLLINATEKVAKRIDRQTVCEAIDTIKANHTLIILRTDCTNVKNFSVRYVTQIDEENFLCDFELVKKEEDPRTAQTKLIDFASYLSQ